MTLSHLASAIALCAMLVPFETIAAQAQRFENPTAGISLSRPSGWNTASQQTVDENRNRVAVGDSALRAELSRLATAPLFVFLKYPDPHPSLNPAVQVIFRPMGAGAPSSATEMMNAVLAGVRAGFADFVLEKNVEATQLSGLPAAHMRGRYTLKTTGGGEFKVLTRMWIVPRGDFLFMIAMNGPQEGADVSEAEFAEVLKSIEIRK